MFTFTPRPLVPLGTGPAFCDRCLHPLDEVLDGFYASCWACGNPQSEANWAQFDDVLLITYLTYYPWSQRLGSDIKYAKDPGEADKVPYIAYPLHQYLQANGDVILSEWRPTITTYVPSHPNTTAARGFDLLGDVVNRRPANVKKFNIRPILRKVNDTEMPPEDREAHPEDWALNEGVDVHAARVMLIDDVLTSGATAAGVAQMLRSNGAAAVFLLAITRTVDIGRIPLIAPLREVPFDYSTCRLRERSSSRRQVS